MTEEKQISAASCKVRYSIFCGIFMGLLILIEKTLWLYKYPGEMSFEHAFLPLFLILSLVVSLFAAGSIMARFGHDADGWAAAILGTAIYIPVVSTGMLVDNIIHPDSCFASAFHINAVCPPLSLITWLSFLARDGLFFSPIVFLIYAIYRVIKRNRPLTGGS